MRDKNRFITSYKKKKILIRFSALIEAVRNHSEYKFFKRNHKTNLRTTKMRAIKWRNKHYSRRMFMLLARRQLPYYRIKQKIQAR